MSAIAPSIEVKPPRRFDGICPRCAGAPKHPGSPYCKPCRNADRRDRRTLRRIPKPVDRSRNEHGLSVFQMRVLTLVCNGLETGQVAKRLEVAPQTVKRARSDMLQITGCLTSPHLACWAAKRGLV